MFTSTATTAKKEEQIDNEIVKEEKKEEKIENTLDSIEI